MLFRQSLPLLTALILGGCASSIEQAPMARLGSLTLAGPMEVPVKIRGRAMIMQLDPDIGARRLLNQSAAHQLGFKGSAIQGGYRIGPIELVANSQAAQGVIGIPGTYRFHWFDRDVAREAAGLISPALLPYDQVVVRLRADTLNGEIRSLRFRGPGTYGFSGGEAIIVVKGEDVAVGISTSRSETIASARVGALLLEQYGGRFEGASQDVEIRYGVQRPVRRLVLERPLAFAGVSIGSLLVRVNELGDASNRRDDADPEEVVVFGRSTRKSKLVLSLGRDALAACDSITFNNKHKRLDLRCDRPGSTHLSS